MLSTRTSRPFTPRAVRPADLPVRSPYALGLPFPTGSQPSLLRHSIAQTEKYRNINLLSIDYAFRPRLRIRLTLGGRTLPRKPWIFGDRDSHPVFRYSCLHDHLYTVHRSSRNGFNPYTTLSYRCLWGHTYAVDFCARANHVIGQQTNQKSISVGVTPKATRGFGSELQSRSFSAQNHSTSELLRTL